MYTEKSTFGELMENPAVCEFIKKVIPGMDNDKAAEFLSGMSVEQLMLNTPEDKRDVFRMAVDLANGKEVNLEAVDPKKRLPEIEANGVVPYDIEDVDGSMYMLDHQFSGCLVLRFTKRMDESVYGEVTCAGKKLPQGIIKTLETAGGMQMFGIPVREILKDYDKDYEFEVKGFRDTDGNEMAPQCLHIHTLPKKNPDLAYQEHDSIALKAAEEGIVLLKNEEHFLPLPEDSRLQVIGGENFRVGAAGAGRINPRYSIRLLRAIEEYSKFTVTEDENIVLFVVSRPSGENFDNNAVKGEFYLSDEEEQVLAGLCREKKQVIAVINSGYPMDLRWTQNEAVKAVLWCGFSGMLGGVALAKILDGRVNPSGKLPDTWSLDYGDIPSSANFYQPPVPEEAPGAGSKLFVDTYYEEDIYVGYRYFETFHKPAAFSFGFGLSYTDFTITAEMNGDTVSATIKNTGNWEGKEVVQLYAEIPDGKLEQPVKRLIGFAKTKNLKPGEEETISLSFSDEDLKSFDQEDASWIIEKGTYSFWIGNSVKNVEKCGEKYYAETVVVEKSENLMQLPVRMDILSKKNSGFPKGLHSGIRPHAEGLEPKVERRHYPSEAVIETEASEMTVEELARMSVCAAAGWGMHEKGEAGRIYQLENRQIPEYAVADGNNGVNINRPNIGMPCSNTVCATWNTSLAYEVGRVVAEEAKENDIKMILAPAMNIHRNPLGGRHPEYFSEDPYLAGIMAGYHSKGLEDNGVSSCIKHVVANNCEASRKRNHSFITERALREIYLRVFEVAMSVHNPDSIMTGYNAVNGCFAAEDEEMIYGIFRKEFGFDGFVMTDWESYESIDIASAVQAGNCWITPGSRDNTYVEPVLEGVRNGKIKIERLRENVDNILKVVYKRQ